MPKPWGYLMPTQLPTQPELPLEVVPLQGAPLETRMRALWLSRWCRWHRARSFEEATADPLTRRLLELAAQHQQAHQLPPTRPRRAPAAQP